MSKRDKARCKGRDEAARIFADNVRAVTHFGIKTRASLAVHVCNINKRLDVLEHKAGCKCKADNSSKRYLVSMDETRFVEVSTIGTKVKWIEGDGDYFHGTEMGYGNVVDSTQEAIKVPGLQPGMLCEAERGLDYKITKVLECHMPIDVDWRRCEKTEYRGNAECMVGMRNGIHGWWCPYLPDTDIQIDCEFEEKPKWITKLDFEKLIELEKLLVAVCKQIATFITAWWDDVYPKIEPVLNALQESKDEAKEHPKLITLAVLKERGVSCKRLLQFQKEYPEGCTLKELVSDSSAMYAGGSLTLKWVLGNLWDDYA